MQEGTFFESLPVKLTSQDILERASQLSALLVKIGQDEAAAKARAAAAKTALEELKADATQLARVVHTKQENRPVECKESYDRINMTVERTRLDTGEVFTSRPMTAEERKSACQEEIDFARRVQAADAAHTVVEQVTETVHKRAAKTAATVEG